MFLVEYLGPILIHPLALFVLRPLLYSASALNPLAYLPFSASVAGPLPAPTATQLLLCALVVAHFVKREYETLFVHRFSAATMPARNLAKNSAHYWLLSGVNLAYWLYAPGARVSAPWWPGALEPATHAAVRHAAVALFVFAQASNYATHVTLRNLRPDGSTKRQIPRGYGFGLVTCPNYMFEALAWLAVAVLAGGNFAAVLFLGVAAGQMALWAKKKESRYRKEFGAAYKKKSAMIPFLW